MYNLLLDFEWVPIHAEMNEVYQFPNPISSHMRKVYKTPAIYRWNVYRHSENCSIAYIGETSNFINRVNGYLKPGPSQMTNIRMRSLFEEYQQNKYIVSIDHMLIKNFVFNDKVYSGNDLSDMSLRKLIENLVILEHKENGYILLNA